MNKKIYIYILIVIALIVAASIYVDQSTKIHISNSAPTQAQNQSQNQTKITLGDYGQAPDFKKGDTWLNSQPLTLADLKGKVVLVDFWTYSCINCIRTLPYVTKWYDTYKNDGFVIVGVHTPEFTFEHDTNNVKNAISQFGIHYPVVQDNDYGIWTSYNNEYWPADYLINQKGEIVEEHFGEGNYTETENDIRYLLGLSPLNSSQAENSNSLNQVGSPEMYFGTYRLANLTPDQKPLSAPADYTINQNLALNNFSLGGNWQFSEPNLQLTGSSGQINLKFHSGKLYMVASSQKPAILTITVDGKQQPSVSVQESKLYTIFDSNDYSDHVVEININQSGFQAFTFTFG
jgi:thiol-disulfide isomerase/thioredoxin